MADLGISEMENDSRCHPGMFYGNRAGEKKCWKENFSVERISTIGRPREIRFAFFLMTITNELGMLNYEHHKRNCKL
jgi:hypothetical protein